MTTSTTHTLRGPHLETLLARVPAEHGPDATIVEAHKIRSGGLAGFFSRETFEVVVEVPARAGARPTPADPAEAPTAAPRAGFAGVLDRMIRDAGAADGSATSRPLVADLDRPAPSATGADRPAPTAAEHPFEPLLPARVTATGASALEPTTAAEGPSALPGVTAPMPVARPTLPAVASLDQASLVRTGLPVGLVAQRTTVSDDPAVELFHLLDRLPRPEDLPRGRGSVLAVAGPRAEALKLAKAFAEALSVDQEEILVAAPTFRGNAVPEHRRLTAVEEAAERRRSWRRRKQPTIVAIDSSVGRVRGTWAGDVLDAIEPTMVWGVVDASRKVEDIRSWALTLGGVDALAVNGLEDTVSPASVLGAGIPVGLLDGAEATTSRWTAIVSECLEVAA